MGHYQQHAESHLVEQLRAELLAVKQQRDELVAALNESSGILEAFKFQSQTAMQQIEINEAALAKVKP